MGKLNKQYSLQKPMSLQINLTKNKKLKSGD